MPENLKTFFGLIILKFYHGVICLKHADTLENIVDPGQTAPKEHVWQSYLGLHCLLRPVCPETSNHYGVSILYRPLC